MATPRFYCPQGLAPDTRLALPDALSHYACRVLRLKDGAEIVLFDGQAGEYPARLEIAGKQAWAHLGAFNAREAELAGALTLVQGLPSGDKMDWIVEKAVELGVQRIVPIAAERSVLHLTGERRDKRVAHWRRVAESASEQCGRNRIMQVQAPQTLRQWLDEPADGMRLLCHPQAPTTLRAALAGAPTALTLIVGPEGGWSEAELALAGHAGQVTTLQWGSRVLRTETAGVALAAACTALLDWA